MGEKNSFQMGIEQQLREWEAQIQSASQTISALKENAGNLEPDVKSEYLDQIQQLEKKIAAAKTKIHEGQQRLDSIKAASEEAWQEIKTGSQQAWNELTLGLNEAWDAMKTSVEQASTTIKDKNLKK